MAEAATAKVKICSFMFKNLFIQTIMLRGHSKIDRPRPALFPMTEAGMNKFQPV
jgi:hypothetical protein